MKLSPETKKLLKYPFLALLQVAQALISQARSSVERWQRGQGPQ